MSEQMAEQPAHEYQRFLQSLPADWGRKEIRQLGTVVGGGTPSRDVPSFWRGTIPWVTPGEVSGNATKFLQDTNEHISASGLAGSGANLLPAGSLMVTTRATLGARAINVVPMATNQGFKSIVFKEAADAGFYLHLFEKVQPELVRRASGTTFLEISAAGFASIEVPSPSPEEKRLITEVLDTLDTAIHETEAIIAKLRAVKHGLLHDLLTRGIDSNGELRPPQAEAPHLYKQSPLGWIPKEWEARPLARSIQLLSGQHIPSELCNAVSKGVPYFTGPSDFCGAGTVVTLYTSYPQVMCEDGDILITVKGSGCGKVAVASVRACISRQLMAIKVPRQALQYWLAVFQSRQESFNRLATGGNIPGISRTQILELTVASPASLDEMTAIGERIRALDSKLEAEEQGLEKLRLKKSGLMDDLLTGRVRVTPLLADAERAKECA